MDSVKELKTDAFNPDTNYVSCPYNSSHRILKARLQYHLVKCRRNVKEKTEEEKVICPLDATHHINKEELAEHMKVCPNRKIVDSERYSMETQEPERASSYKLPDMPPCEENWDDPSEEPYTYDPTPHLENQPILRTMHGATKSERKAFRQVERMKMIQFHSGQPMNTAAAADAVGVTISNGKILARGRGNQPIPLGQEMRTEGVRGGRDTIDVEKIIEEGVGQTLPPDVIPLRHPKINSVAVRLLEWRDDEDGSEPQSPQNYFSPANGISFENKVGMSKNADIVSGSGLMSNVNYVTKVNQIPPAEDSWNYNGSNSTKGSKTPVNLDEYKEKVKESKLAAKMGISVGETAVDDTRAHDFTYLDDEWQIQGRRGRIMRHSPRASPGTGAISKGRNW